MKKIIITIFTTLLFSNLFSQSDSISVDSVKMYQYRIKLSNITTNGSANLAPVELLDIFKSKLIFNETLSQFVFISNQDVEFIELKRFLDSTDYSLIYFRKEKVLKLN